MVGMIITLAVTFYGFHKTSPQHVKLKSWTPYRSGSTSPTGRHLDEEAWTDNRPNFEQR
jgi:hypothetical protein